MPRRGPLRVKFILPALTEATSPFWRPIKYSLFPPLGLATLAAYLDAGRRGVARRRARPASDPRRRCPGPGRDPGLHHERLSGLPPRRSLPRAGQLRGPRRTARHLAPARGRAPRRRHLPRPRGADVPAVPRRLPRGPPGAAVRLHGRAHARTTPAGAARPHQAPQLSRPELDRRHARLSAALRLLLQGRVLCRRPLLLHPARGRRARRDRAVARSASLLPRRPSPGRSPLRRGRSSTACGA